MITFYSNPACSTCQRALALVQEKVPGGENLKIIRYLESPPSPEEIRLICSELGVHPKEVVREKEGQYQDLKEAGELPSTEAEWYQLLHDQPVLIQRPIVRMNGRAVIARPPEEVMKLFGAAESEGTGSDRTL